MTLLITGASGHVGANLLRELLSRQERVRALVRTTTNREPFAGLDVELVTGDLRDLDAMRAAMRGCDGVYHCAAKVATVRGEEQELFDVNVRGTRNLLEAARLEKVKRVVVTSSLGAVGQPKDRACTEDDPFNPFEHHLPYEASKASVEHECLEAVARGTDVVMAISTAVLGPWDFGPSRMGRVIKDFANGQLRAYIPGGFEFVGAGDLARGHVLAMEKGRTGRRYIFSSSFLSVDDLMDMLARISGTPKPSLRLPPGLMMGIAHLTTFVMTRVAPKAPLRFTPDAVRLLSMRRTADISRAKNELGYRPTPIEDAVRRAYEWFVEHGDIAGKAPARPPAAREQQRSTA